MGTNPILSQISVSYSNILKQSIEVLHTTYIMQK